MTDETKMEIMEDVEERDLYGPLEEARNALYLMDKEPLCVRDCKAILAWSGVTMSEPNLARAASRALALSDKADQLAEEIEGSSRHTSLYIAHKLIR